MAVRLLPATLACWLGLVVLLLAAPLASAAIKEFPLAAQSVPFAITSGPDAALWFTELGSGLGAGNARIGRITTGGTVTEFPIPTTNAFPSAITRGPDGALWFTEGFVPKIGRITTGGSFTEFPVAAAGGRVLGIAAGPDGALWFTADGQIGRITTTGAVTLFGLRGADAQSDIAAGPDGAMWFTEQNANSIGRITTAGAITEFPVPTPGSVPEGITAGPDGALWFTEFEGNKIARVTTAGTITEFPIGTPASGPGAITAGPDGALWFVETLAQKIGRITTAGAITDFRLRAGARDITAGPDGALWFPANDAIGRITTDHPREDAVDGTLFTEAPCNPPQIGCTKPRYVFGVSSRPSGEAPFGRVSYVTGERQGTMAASGSPTCLRVEGRRAAIGVELAPDAGLPAGPPLRAAIIVVEDNGPASADRFAVQDLPVGSAPSACPSPAGVALGPAFGPSAGSSDPGVVVVDVQAAPPAPTSKDQCKHGGWQAFGLENQGQCIALVQRGPKPPKP